MAHIFSTCPLPGRALKTLAETHQVDVYTGEEPISRELLLQGIEHADVLICQLRDSIDKEVIKAGQQLKVIANYAVGTNNIAVDWATLRDIVVLNTPNILTDATADLAMGLLLSTARRIPESDQYVRDGQWEGWRPTQMLGTHVTGKTLGIVGMGRIGQAVAARAQAFRMKIIYHNRHRLPLGIERELGAQLVSLEELAQNSDFISLHCPLTYKTKHLIDEDFFEHTQPHSILINTARGPIVDEEALVEALEDGKLHAAGLDVFEEEPSIHPALLKMKNVVLTPHTGSATHETREGMAELLARTIEQVLNNYFPPNIVNTELYPSAK